MIRLRSTTVIKFLSLILLWVMVVQLYSIWNTVWNYPRQDLSQILTSKFNNITTIALDKNIDLFDENFYNFFPSKVSLDNLYVHGAFPLNSTLFPDLINHTREIFESSCPENTKVVLFMISDPMNYLLRKEIRESYGKNRRKYKYEFIGKQPQNIAHCFLFSIGYREDQTINQQVDYESYIYKDIIRIPIFDQYRQTSHKIMLTLHLLDKMDSDFEMILKADDDIFIKVNKVVPYLLSLNEKNVFIGAKQVGVIPIRQPDHKWYVSKEDYPGNIFKPYLMGACYVFRRNIIEKIFQKHYVVKSIPMEDIHISYLVSKSGYKITDSYKLYHCKNFNDCKDSLILDMGRNIFRRKYILKIYQKEYESVI